MTWSLNPTLTLIAIRQPTQVFVFYQYNSSKLHEQCESWLLLDGITLDVEVSYYTRWIFDQFSGSSRLLFKSLLVRFVFSVCNKLIPLKSVPNVISSMTLLNFSSTPGIVTTRIGSMSNVTARCPCGGVDWITERRWDTEFWLCTWYNSRLWLKIWGKLFCARSCHSVKVFPHKIDCGNRITTFSLSILYIIAAATEVKVFPRPMSSATRAPGISESQTHLSTIHCLAQTRCSRNFVLDRPGIESCGLKHGDLLICESDGHLAAWLPHQDTHVHIHCWFYWEQYSIMNWNYLDWAPPCHPLAPGPLLHLGRFTFHPHWSVWVPPRYVGPMGSYSGAHDIRRDVSYFTATHLNPLTMWNTINSIHSIRTYINTTVSLFSTCLLIHHSFIFIWYLWRLHVLISSGV